MSGTRGRPRARVLTRRVIHKGHWTLETVSLEQTRRDGSRQTIQREIFGRADAATVLLFDAARDTVILTRQLRVPALLNGGRQSLIETCAGLIEQDPESCAAREAFEETGYRPRNLRRLFDAYMSPGGVTERVYFFLADYTHDDRLEAGGGLAHEGEDIDVLELAFDDAYAMIASGEIADAKTIILLQRLKIEKLGGM
jgi:nudix-type nucleoside diphosphatase (YffH/AdpP family)